jgi:hypothetical protein
MEVRTAEWALLEARAAGIQPLGVLIADEYHLHVRMRPDWRKAIPQEDSDGLRDYETYIPEIAEEVGIVQVLNWFETSSTLPIRIATRQEFQVTDANLALESLYRERVLLPPPKPIGSGADIRRTPGRGGVAAFIDWFHRRRSYKVFWAVVIPVFIVALLLLQRHLLRQRYSQIGEPALPQKVELPSSIAISELPLTSFVGVERPYLDGPLLLRRPAIRTRRQNTRRRSALVKREFKGELTTDVLPSPSAPAILPAAPPLDITVDARPQTPPPMPLPAPAPYHPKRNRFLHFFFALFHKAPQQNRDGEKGQPQQRDNPHETKTTADSGGVTRGLR